MNTIAKIKATVKCLEDVRDRMEECWTPYAYEDELNLDDINESIELLRSVMADLLDQTDPGKIYEMPKFREKKVLL